MTAAPPRVAIGGATMTLHPERAALWVEQRTLLVADAHFGKAASFRSFGVAVPEGTTADGLRRLDALLARTAARRVVFLGDFLHARSGRAPGTLQALAAWRAQHAAVELLLVRGNHDRGAGDPPPELEIACVDEPAVEAPLVLAHYPQTSPAGYVLAGHLHPGVRLTGPGRQRERLPCFWLGATHGVLPAFGEFTGLAEVAPLPGDQVWVIAGDAVVPVSADRRA